MKGGEESEDDESTVTKRQLLTERSSHTHYAHRHTRAQIPAKKCKNKPHCEDARALRSRR